MSGIFGIFNRNGMSVEKKIVDTMLDAMSYWKPDDSGIWIEGSVAFGHTMLWNTPESKQERLPNRQSSYIITMDARLDNREELVEKLQMSDRLIDQITDSDLILAAYCRWGEVCPKYLLGDFVFAIWDEKMQQLFCARDHIGIKQFYFHMTDDLFIFGNDLKGLVVHPDISKKINDEAIANYLVNFQLRSPILTFFKDIEKLPPATSLIISGKNISKRCYWRLEDAPKIKLPHTEDYAKKLRELLEKAVYARMRSDYPITSHLSGGLDSSSIAVLAARKLKKKGEKLLAFNWLHVPTPEDDSMHHEWSHSMMIAEIENIEHHYVPLNVKDIHDYMENDTIIYGHSARFWYENPIRYFAQEKGSRSILSGWGGDELSTYHGRSYYSDLFLHGAWRKLFQELQIKAYSKQKSVKRMMSAVYHQVFVPLVPRWLYCKLPKIICFKDPSFILVKKLFSPLVEKETKKPCMLTMQPQKTIRKDMLTYYNHGHIQSRIESWATAANSNRLEYSYPLLDKRIIEFILGSPPDCFVYEGVGRYLFRSAVKGLLPEKILWTTEKQEPKRVERLISMMLSAYRLLVSRKRFSEISSEYIDSKNLMELLENLQCHSMDRDAMVRLQQLETSLSLLMSLRDDTDKKTDTLS